MISEHQVTMVSLDELVSRKHQYRKFKSLFKFDSIKAELLAVESEANKNFDLDKYYTKIRSPFERVFSQDNNRLRYIGIARIQFAEFMNALCFNLRRLAVLTAQNAENLVF